MKNFSVFATIFFLFLFTACSYNSKPGENNTQITQASPATTIIPIPTNTLAATFTHIATPELTSTPPVVAGPTLQPTKSSTPLENKQEPLSLVLIDSQEAAYTVYLGIPESIKDAELEEIQTIASEEGGVNLISWEDFEGNLEQYLTAKIVLNEYKNAHIEAGVTELIQRYPMTPFGLTWNGGIAFTFNDYQYADEIYQQYRIDPDEYSQTNNRDPKGDPTNPQNHLPPLLDW